MVNQDSTSRLVSKPFLKVCWVSPLICLKTNHRTPQVPCRQTVFRGLLPWLSHYPCPPLSAPTGPKAVPGWAAALPLLLEDWRSCLMALVIAHAENWSHQSSSIHATHEHPGPWCGKQHSCPALQLHTSVFKCPPPHPPPHTQSTMLANAAHDKRAPYLSPFSTLCGGQAIFLP